MAFDIAQTVTPTSIGGIRITLYENPNGTLPDGGIGLIRTVSYEVEVLDQNNARMRTRGDIGNLIPHLTSQQMQALLQFMDDMRTKANAEILG
jgi:hypothetical protein